MSFETIAKVLGPIKNPFLVFALVAAYLMLDTGKALALSENPEPLTLFTGLGAIIVGIVFLIGAPWLYVKLYQYPASADEQAFEDNATREIDKHERRRQRREAASRRIQQVPT